MGYFVRVLSTSDKVIPLTQIRDALSRDKFQAKLECDQGSEEAWELATLYHYDNTAIAQIERNIVSPGSLGEAELEEFSDDIEGEHPQQAVLWLNDYFPRVRTVYSLKVLSGTYARNGWDIFGCVKGAIWNFAPSIIQADAEGFSDEDGYHILWQFSDKVDGSWAMGVLKDGKWLHFQMDLGNRKHRESFCKGEVPKGCEIIS